MSHHGDLPPSELLRELEQQKKKFNLGATGEYPEGKLDKTDEGELRLAVAHTNDKVVINFGKEVSWIGFNKVQALDLAHLIIQHAAQCK